MLTVELQIARARIDCMKQFLLVLVGLGVVLAVSAKAQRGTSLPNDLPAVDAAAMLKTAAPDLQKRIARFKPVRMPFDAASLSARERQMIDQLDPIVSFDETVK
jgi:hypothetical protein